MRLVRYPDTARFRAELLPWLSEEEAANNLVIGLTARTWEWIELMAVLDEEGAPLGAAVCTPPRKAILTDMPDGAVDLLAEACRDSRPDLPGVTAPERVALRFAAAYRPGAEAAVDMRLGLHLLERVVPPPRPPGVFRLAAAQDVSRIASWYDAFLVDVGDRPHDDAQAWAQRHVDAGTLAVWERDGAATAMAAQVRETPHGAAISAVYTPPEERRNGYATALVADLSQLLLDRGRRYLVLYTDLANPTSNAIYRRIGYRRIQDSISLRFRADAEGW